MLMNELALCVLRAISFVRHYACAEILKSGRRALEGPFFADNGYNMVTISLPGSGSPNSPNKMS